METGQDGIVIIRSPYFERMKCPCIRFSNWSRPESMSFPEHRHLGKWEIVYVRAGVLLNTVNGRAFEQRRGDFILLRETERHSTENIDGESLNISISPEYFDYLKGPDPDGLIRRLLESEEVFMGRIPAEEQVSFERRLEKLMFAQGTQRECAVFCALFFEMCSYCTETRKADGALAEQQPEWLRKCISHYKENPGDRISIESIEHLCGRSQEHVTRCFRRHLNMTPSQFVNRIRLEQATKLLLHSNKSVKEITTEIGYSSYAYFFRLFKNMHGLSPNEFRALNASTQ